MTHLVNVPAIPIPTDEPAALYQSVMALKANVENIQGVTTLTRVKRGPTATNTEIGAAKRAVQGTYP